jgi:hypothetical protein
MRTAEAISFYSGLSAAAKTRAQDNPLARGAQFYAAAYETYAQDAKDQSVLDTAQTRGEIIELRLIGQKASQGTLPVSTFVDFLTPMRQSIVRAGHVARYGKEAKTVAPDVKNDLDLRVAGIGSGSTRIFLSGSPLIDTTGTNLLSAVACNFFDLLHADKASFDSAVDAIGPTSLTALGRSLRKLASAGLSAEFSWTKDGHPISWNGDVNEISRIVKLIDSHSPPETFEQVLEGIVSAISDRGRIELTSGSDRIKIRYALKDHELARQLTFAERASIRVRTSRTLHTATDEVTETHLLLDLA